MDKRGHVGPGQNGARLGKKGEFSGAPRDFPRTHRKQGLPRPGTRNWTDFGNRS